LAAISCRSPPRYCFRFPSSSGATSDEMSLVSSRGEEITCDPLAHLPRSISRNARCRKETRDRYPSPVSYSWDNVDGACVSGTWLNGISDCRFQILRSLQG